MIILFLLWVLTFECESDLKKHMKCINWKHLKCRWRESKKDKWRLYGDIITTFSQFDGLPIFLTNGGSLACFARWSSTVIGLKLFESVPPLNVESHTGHYCPHGQSLSQFSIAARMPFHLRVTPNIAQVSIYIIHIPKVEKDCMGQRSLFYKTTWWQDQVLSPNLEIWNQMALRTSTWICYHLFSIAFSMWFKDYRHIKCGLAESQQKLSIST